MKSFSLCSCLGNDRRSGETRMKAESPSSERTRSFLNSSAISLHRDAQGWRGRGFDFKSINRLLNKKLCVSNNFPKLLTLTLGQLCPIITSYVVNNMQLRLSRLVNDKNK